MVLYSFAKVSKHHLTQATKSCLYFRSFSGVVRFMRKNIRKIIMLVASLPVFFFIFPVSYILADNTRLTIIHSSNLNGYLVPCPT